MNDIDLKETSYDVQYPIDNKQKKQIIKFYNNLDSFKKIQDFINKNNFAIVQLIKDGDYYICIVEKINSEYSSNGTFCIPRSNSLFE